MTLKIHNYLFFLFLLGGIIFISSCKKSGNEQVESKYIPVVQDYVAAENYFDNAFCAIYNALVIIDNKLKTTDSTVALSDTCPAIKILPFDTITWPKTLTIDYGNGFTDKNGNILSGQITVEISGHYNDSGTVIHANLFDFSRNNIKAFGEAIITNKKRQTGDNIFSLIVDSAFVHNITDYERHVIVFKMNRLITKSSTKVSDGVYADIFSITDSSTINSGSIQTLMHPNLFYCNYYDDILANGTKINPIIKSKVVISSQCKYIQSGTVNLIIPDQPIIQVNLTNTSCNNTAIYSMNGYTIPFKIEK